MMPMRIMLKDFQPNLGGLCFRLYVIADLHQGVFG
jgi:hypothetical protein